MNVYHVNKRTSNGKWTNAYLTIPAKIADILPAGMAFTCELTEQGILYRPVDSVVPETPVAPLWLTEARRARLNAVLDHRTESTG